MVLTETLLLVELYICHIWSISFSISRRMEEVWKLGGDKTSVWLQNNNRAIKFDIKMKPNKEKCIVHISNVV